MTFQEKVQYLALEQKVGNLEHLVGTLLEALVRDLRPPDPYANNQHHQHDVEEYEDLLKEFHYADDDQYHLFD
jgi:hypothetical protein